MTILPILWGFFSIGIFAVDIPFLDQWDIEIPLILEYYQGTLSPSDFLVIHNDHRPVIPLIIIITSYILTGMNTITVNYLSYIIYVSMIAGFLYLARQMFQNRSLFWIFSIPVSWYMFNPYLLVSFQCGMQIYYSLMLAFLVLGVWLLDKSKCLDIPYFGSICCAFAAFFSFSGGMFLWPALFVMILLKKSDQWLMKLLVWIGAAMGTFLLNYVILGFSKTGIHGTAGYAVYINTLFHYPLHKLLCYLGAVGSTIIHNKFCAFFPGFLLLILLILLFIHNRLDLNLQNTAKWYALITFGLLVSLAVTITRSGHGDIFGPENMLLFTTDLRHFPGMILLLPATYLLSISYLGGSLCNKGELNKPIKMSEDISCISGNAFLFGSVFLLLCLGIGFHLIPGIGLAYEWNQHQSENQDALTHYLTSTDQQLEQIYPLAEKVRRKAGLLQDNNLGVFRDDWKKPERHMFVERLHYFKNISFQ